MNFAASIRIYTILYGDYPLLHKRILDSLRAHVPGDCLVTIWCNQAAPWTKTYLASHGMKNWSVTWSFENVSKYKVMRTLFHPQKHLGGDREWIIWFDDDSWITHPDWFQRMEKFIANKTPENVCYIGQPWFIHQKPGQGEFISAAKWYKGLPPETDKKGKPVLNFAQGAYWWLRNDVLKLLDWPDERLNHNGGDTLLGEAVRQQGLPFHKNFYGVKVNDALRRGLSEAPAGCRDKNTRI